MKLYVIRHGESENNLSKLWTGWMQVNLTEKGKEQARAIRPILEKVAFDRIYTSDLWRAQQTAEQAIPGCRYESIALLREVNVGDLAGKPLDSVTPEQREELASEGYIIFGGESRAEFEARVKAFAEKIEKEDAENIAAFCHGGFLTTMLEYILGVKYPRKAVYCGNCAMAIFEYESGRWRLHSWINS